MTFTYHPNKQCDCEGCRHARAVRLFTGARLLEDKIGMPSCYDTECAMCKALKTPVAPPPYADDWRDSQNIEQLKGIIAEQDRWLIEAGEELEAARRVLRQVLEERVAERNLRDVSK